MSRTSIRERNKAIRKAWEREQQLVKEGKGTRDWTIQQQQDILDPTKGKAYDDNNNAFEGQHMKSASKYPDYQGDPDNIQFLTREEHLEAHKGSWQNSTNWYYDPINKEFYDFGDGDIVPCKIIELSVPINISSKNLDTSHDEGEGSKSFDIGGKDDFPSKQSETIPSEVKVSPKVSKNLRERIKGVVEAVKGFGERHPVIISAIKGAGIMATAVVAGGIVNGGKGSGVGSDDSDSSSINDYFSGFSDVDDSDSLDGGDSDSYDDGYYSENRSSPEEHMVSEHFQHYHTKEGFIEKKGSIFSWWKTR